MNNDQFEDYLGWLEPQIRHLKTSKKYYGVFEMMATTEFVWLVPNDDNRIEDGLGVRREYIYEYEVDGFNFPCSVLEVLIGLSRRLSFQVGGPAPQWAWILMCNLGLDKIRDPIGVKKRQKAEDILEALVWRNYEADGRGGFFPVSHPLQDQRKIEIWDQMAEYVNELHPEY